MASKAQGNIGSKGKLTRHDPSELADSVAEALLNGEGLRRSPHLGTVSDDDRRRLQRITGETVDQFNDRIRQKLNLIADLASDRVIEKLEANEFKASELGFIQSVAFDKGLALSGRSQVQNASINTVINVFGSTPKDSLIASLMGRHSPSPIEAIPCPPELSTHPMGKSVMDRSARVAMSDPSLFQPMFRSSIGLCH